MTGSDISAQREQRRQGPIERFRGVLERDGISASTTRFKDAETEARYMDSLVKGTLPTERVLWISVIGAYFSFGILDILTIRENLEHFLWVRLFTGLAIVGLIPLSFVGRIKPHFGWLSAAAIFISAQAIIYMILMMPAEGSPPYIIGVLVVFIATSCLMRIPFRVAASVYIFSSLVYFAVLSFDTEFTSIDRISGYFFMFSIVNVAVLTIYTQEIRARMIWLRDEQRQRDAAIIEKLLIEATAADQSKINFLSMMSHELRTPLHQIIGYTEVVTNACKAANDDDENVRHLNEIHGSAHVLLARIQKMLRFADATAGKMKYELADTPVSELVDVSIEQMRGGLEKKSISVDTSELEDASIDIDIVHTCYALNNILENAIAASPQNATLWVKGARLADGGYELVLRDEGKGMSAQQIDKVLKPFTQGEHALARSREGMGLGLTLATRIFRDQRASIRLESKEGNGLSVIITFAAPVELTEDAVGPSLQTG
ncbi:HAMP domain-containing sensor histidine kinase [Hyphococcus flavus]|uniref:histidine kinase n=1 Tax=Hyphococcus flavus TaxID=1866326 RepID=A0AAF0CFR7_9PROT|nr:HAMP domain-containing sensor histidine kinase [Hyphococcus flavus]WDI32726.1 HAMP domain-containing sensor histidine kinase [Hyphococcus flavus]